MSKGRRIPKQQQTFCWLHKKAIKGKVYRWHNHQVCKFCYSRLCADFRVARAPEKPKSLWQLIFG